MRLARALPCLMFLLAAAVPVFGQQAASNPSKANFERLCGSCHEPERSTSSRRTRDQWLQTVNQMVARGAEGTDAELMDIVEYLTREQGRVNVNLGSAADIALVLGLTAAEGDAVVQYRREHGTFEDFAAVERVPGVDARKLAARRDAVVFGSRVAAWSWDCRAASGAMDCCSRSEATVTSTPCINQMARRMGRRSGSFPPIPVCAA